MEARGQLHAPAFDILAIKLSEFFAIICEIAAVT
jgi:hypothetical protein